MSLLKKKSVLMFVYFSAYMSALQACLSFIGEEGVTLDFIALKLNMYTTPALLAAVFGLINILLVVILLR